MWRRWCRLSSCFKIWNMHYFIIRLFVHFEGIQFPCLSQMRRSITTQALHAKPPGATLRVGAQGWIHTAWTVEIYTTKFLCCATGFSHHANTLLMQEKRKIFRKFGIIAACELSLVYRCITCTPFSNATWIDIFRRLFEEKKSSCVLTLKWENQWFEFVPKSRVCKPFLSRRRLMNTILWVFAYQFCLGCSCVIFIQ